MTEKNVVVFGGSGFLGRNLVQKLAKNGAMIRGAVRHEASALFLKTMGEIGQITLFPLNTLNPDSVLSACQNADSIINLTGILFEKGRQTFENVHVKGAENIAKAAATVKAKRLIHISAIGADPQAPSEYAATKGQGEKIILKHFPQATILRPSILFGPDDDFFNRFATLAQFSIALPAFGGGHNKMQPVYVGDVSQAIIRCLEDPKTTSNIYEVGGPKVYSFKELMTFTCETIGRKRLILPLPYQVGQLLGAFLQFLPTPPLTPDQILLLKSDNIVNPKEKTLKDLKISPKSLETIAPDYLRRFRPRF